MDDAEKKESPTRSKKKGGPGRKSNAQKEIENAQAELELRELNAEQKQKLISDNFDPVRTLLNILVNDTVLSRLPDDLKAKGCAELDDQEMDKLTNVIIPVLDRLGLLGGLDNPYFAFVWVSYTIFSPRIKFYLEWKNENKTKSDDQVNLKKEQKQPAKENVKGSKNTSENTES